MRLPNILFIIADQLRADHLGCYGNEIVRTPNIDSLAKRGMAFDRFYVTTPICMPNRATLMTGRLPSLHGVRSNGIPLAKNQSTFVELLAARGYDTAMIGKSHLQTMSDERPMVNRQTKDGDAVYEAYAEARKESLRGVEYEQEIESRWNDPAHKVDVPFYGFDHVEICDGHGDQAFGNYSHWLREQAVDVDALRGEKSACPANDYICPQAWRTRLPEELYPTTYVAERTIRYLQEHAQNQSGRPFFLKCSFTDPHHPFTPPGRYWGMYDPGQIPVPPTCKAPADGAPAHLKWLHEERASGRTNLNAPRAIAINEREAREAIALTYGMVTMLDDTIGRILDTLATLGLSEDTLVIFTSDHGDFMGDHGLLFKAPLHYQGLLRVPFIWAEPRATHGAAGSRCGELFSTLDIARTMLERVDVAPYNGIQGQSFLGFVTDRLPRNGNDALLIEEDGQRVWGGFERPVRCRTLLGKRWRLTVYQDVEWGELYDLQSDPHETRNLWADEAFSGVRAELMCALVHKMISACDRSMLPTRIA